jgi:hypothetical protein
MNSLGYSPDKEAGAVLMKYCFGEKGAYGSPVGRVGWRWRWTPEKQR